MLVKGLVFGYSVWIQDIGVLIALYPGLFGFNIGFAYYYQKYCEKEKKEEGYILVSIAFYVDNFCDLKQFNHDCKFILFGGICFFFYI